MSGHESCGCTWVALKACVPETVTEWGTLSKPHPDRYMYTPIKYEAPISIMMENGSRNLCQWLPGVNVK